jgi:DNA polymerase elongation subunit (family B)
MFNNSILSGKLRDTTLSKRTAIEILDNIIDIREYDIPYYIRVAIDNGKLRGI